ncbi:MAG: site-specific integrase, partial [Microvirga sp.]|nr:site-specific integrase [Microvirga sp.]
DFQLRGAKFRGPTGCTTEREARAFERQKREEAKKESDRRQALGRGAPLTWAEVASRYWREHGQFHKPDTGTLQALTWLTRGIGEKTLIAHINGDVVGRLVAKRRADGVSNATVNRTVTEPLRRVLQAAKEWGEQVQPIKFGRHLLKEPRLSECTGLTWDDVDFGNRLVWINGKGGVRASIPLGPTVRELIFPLRGDHERFVFTFVACRNRKDMRKGERRPLSAPGLQREFLSAIKRAGVRDFRFHDLRHSAASRVLRATGNLVVVQQLLRHSKIAMTARYAHVTGKDVMDAVEKAAAIHAGLPITPSNELSSDAKSAG